MRRVLCWLSLTITMGSFLPSHTSPTNTQDLSTTSNNFTSIFVKTLLSSRTNFTDFLVSAFNVQEAMFLLLNAAENVTYEEIARVYGLPHSPSCLGNVNAQFKNFLNLLQVNSKETQVELATALYVQKECPLKSRYKQDMIFYYGAKTEAVDFQHDSVEITNKINTFVDEKTHHKISKLYEEPLPSDTRLIILAVLYFNSSWYDNFFVLNDKTAVFHLSPGGTKQLLYLNNHNGEKRAGYTVLDSCQVVRILYANTNYSFFVLLPPRGQDPAICLRGLTAEKIDLLYNTTEYKQRVNVTLPRFAFNYEFDNLIPYFRHLGVRQLDVDANLRHAIDQSKCEHLTADQIIHKARIDVSEKGTTAVAVTSISVRSLAMPIFPSEPIQFLVDRAFAFLITSSRPRIVLFTGICANPIYPNN